MIKDKQKIDCSGIVIIGDIVILDIGGGGLRLGYKGLIQGVAIERPMLGIRDHIEAGAVDNGLPHGAVNTFGGKVGDKLRESVLSDKDHLGGIGVFGADKAVIGDGRGGGDLSAGETRIILRLVRRRLIIREIALGIHDKTTRLVIIQAVYTIISIPLNTSIQPGIQALIINIPKSLAKPRIIIISKALEISSTNNRTSHRQN